MSLLGAVNRTRALPMGAFYSRSGLEIFAGATVLISGMRLVRTVYLSLNVFFF